MGKKTIIKTLIVGMFKALKVLFVLVSGSIIAIVTTLLGLLVLLLGFIRSGLLNVFSVFKSSRIKRNWLLLLARRNARLSALQKLFVSLTVNR